MIVEKIILGISTTMIGACSILGIKSISNPSSLTIREQCINNGRALIDSSSYRPLRQYELEDLVQIKEKEADWFSFSSDSNSRSKQEQLISKCKELFNQKKEDSSKNWEESLARAEKYCSVEE